MRRARRVARGRTARTPNGKLFQEAGHERHHRLFDGERGDGKPAPDAADEKEQLQPRARGHHGRAHGPGPFAGDTSGLRVLAPISRVIAGERRTLQPSSARPKMSSCDTEPAARAARPRPAPPASSPGGDRRRRRQRGEGQHGPELAPLTLERAGIAKASPVHDLHGGGSARSARSRPAPSLDSGGRILSSRPRRWTRARRPSAHSRSARRASRILIASARRSGYKATRRHGGSLETLAARVHRVGGGRASPRAGVAAPAIGFDPTSVETRVAPASTSTRTRAATGSRRPRSRPTRRRGCGA